MWLAKPGPFDDASYPDYADLREGAAGVVDIAAYIDADLAAYIDADLAAYIDADLALGSGGEPVRVPGLLVSDNYFRVLGAAPARGRAFLPEANRAPGAQPVAVIGHDLWQRRFGGDPGVVGGSVVINGHGFTVVGVAPAGFVGTDLGHQAELWVPIMMQPVAKPVRYDMLGDRRSP